jgi:hypothetical protein
VRDIQVGFEGYYTRCPEIVINDALENGVLAIAIAIAIARATANQCLRQDGD